MKTRIYSDNDGAFQQNDRAATVTLVATDCAQWLRPLPGETHVIRLEKVIRARKLINDKDYPSWDVLAAVAGLLAGNLGNLKPNRGRS